MSKIKVLTYNKAGYDKAVKHAVKLGAKSRDGNTTFNPDKTSLVIDQGFMMCSKAGYTPKKKPYDAIISKDQFVTMTSLMPSTGSAAGVPKSVAPAGASQAEVKQAKSIGYGLGFQDGEAVGYAVGHDDGSASVAPQKTLRCTAATILEQNPVVWAAMGVPFFRDNGVDIVEQDGKMYTIDLVTNTAVEFTALTAAAQAKEDMLAGDNTVYTQFVKNFDLADEIVFSKVLVDENSEA